MENYGVPYSPFDVGPPRRDQWRRSASGASRGGLEVTDAALTGAGSITAAKRLLQVRLAPLLAHLHDLLTLRAPVVGCAATLCSDPMELRAGRLAQHSMHLADSESCAA